MTVATNEPRPLSQAEAAAKAGVSVRTVARWITAGHLPARKRYPARRVLIEPSDLERLLAGVPAGPNPSPGERL